MRIVLFALVPMVPVAIMLVVSSMLFEYPFVGRHLDIVAFGPAFRTQYVEMEKKLDELRTAVTAARVITLQRNAAAASDDVDEMATDEEKVAARAAAQARDVELRSLDAEFTKAAGEVAKLAAVLKSAAVPILDAARPVALSSRPVMIGLQNSQKSLEVEVGLASAAITACECPAVERDTFIAVLAEVSGTLGELKTVLSEWTTAKARQSGAMMKAVNATIILIIVTVGALFWGVSCLLPSEFDGPNHKSTLALRIMFITSVIVLFLAILVVPYVWPKLPLVPYREITLELFDRTLSYSLAPGFGWFLGLNYAAIGLATAALLAVFSATAVTAWTYDYTNLPAPASAVRRMAIVRNSLYAGALVCIASLLALQTDFTAAASLFAVGVGDPAAANPTRILIDEIGGAIVQATGIGLGLALAAAYLPAAIYLYPAYQAEKAAETAAAPGGTFSLIDSGAFGMILRFLAILAPALVEPISKALGGE